MHESGPTKKLMEHILAEAQRRSANRVAAVKVKLGAGTGMSSESLRLHFEHAAEGTIAEGACLDIEEVPITYHCEGCGADVESAEQLLFCPKCEEPKLKAVSGEEILVTSLELA
ncbi:MAG: hydrogenase maturation nickel metallochaperone HypA/HybF [Armatimonadota bacterium]